MDLAAELNRLLLSLGVLGGLAGIVAWLRPRVAGFFPQSRWMHSASHRQCHVPSLSPARRRAVDIDATDKIAQLTLVVAVVMITMELLLAC